MLPTLSTSVLSILGTDALTIDNENALNIPAKKVWSEDDNAMVYTAVLTDIPFSWYNEKIVALSYVVSVTGYEPDGTVIGNYTYVGIGGAADAPVKRSYKQVADAAYAADQTNAALKQIANTPVTLPGGADIAGYKLLTDFDNNFATAQANATRGSWKIVDTMFGKSFCMYGDSTTTNTGGSPQIDLVKLSNTVDVTGYTGLIFYVDTKGVEPEGGASDYMTISVPFNLKVNADGTGGNVWQRSYAASGETSAYYYDGTQWNATTGNDRFKLPNQFVGYVYVPFAAYQRYGDTRTPWATDVATNKYITDMDFFTDKITGNVGSIVLDNFYIVK